MNINEARLIEENERWETHWVFLRSWLEDQVSVDNTVSTKHTIPVYAKVLAVMGELRPSTRPFKPRLFKAEKDLKRIASVLSDYGGIRTLFSMKEEDLNFEEKALARIYEILQGVDEQ